MLCRGNHRNWFVVSCWLCSMPAFRRGRRQFLPFRFDSQFPLYLFSLPSNLFSYYYEWYSFFYVRRVRLLCSRLSATVDASSRLLITRIKLSCFWWLNITRVQFLHLHLIYNISISRYRPRRGNTQLCLSLVRFLLFISSNFRMWQCIMSENCTNVKRKKTVNNKKNHISVDCASAIIQVKQIPI